MKLLSLIVTIDYNMTFEVRMSVPPPQSLTGEPTLFSSSDTILGGGG